MEYRILGPLEVLENGRPLPLGRLKERMVLAVLLLHANEFVSRERLVDDLWGAAPPPTARKAVNVYVSQLRKTLARNGDDPIATAYGGYRLLVDRELLDVERLRSLLADARPHMEAGECAAAALLLRQALELWRGPTLAGLQLESLGRDETAQLDELRLTALMDRIDCDLAQGRHEQVLGELQVLVREHPLRERLRAQQMLALYRSDRQADALDAYRQARHVLIDELGIEPSESLQRLQQAILRHDSALELAPGTVAADGAAPALPSAAADGLAALPARSRPRRALRRRALATAAVAAVAAVAAPLAILFARGGGPKPPSSPVSFVSPDSVARIDPGTGTFVDFEGGSKPGSMAVVGKVLWILRGDRLIQPYDLRTQRETPPFPAGTGLDLATDGDGNVWVSQRRPVVTWIRRPASYDANHPYATPVVTSQDVSVPLPGAGAEAVGGGFLWVISNLPGRIGESVSLVDLHRRRLAATIALGRQTTALAYGYGSAWVGTYDQRHSTAWLLKVRAGSKPIESLKLESGDGAGPLAVAVGDGSVWAVTSRGNLLRIDPEGPRVTRSISMAAQQPTLLAVGAGSVWTANHTGYSVSQVDPQKNRVVRTIPLGSYESIPCGLQATPTAVFVSFGETTCG